ncbi:acyl-CoA dehydrogenase [Xanthomonas campestris pv. raphani]|uniref:acyl-CoA dehydrogenase n=1 Tax=Xanthomonas campestris TaxID=339 RepID=UPI001E3ABA58|nr:acyl-CoA dehydrogenase [Xanthomonas campestris]MCC8484313.1 acyl-CoA dehydrogenase [Xanthomonas campestris]MEA9651576.1 acyl-CoA dehydrogenase [Xanthomonas campestris pv. raphani]MEA9743294.1 acyl-CoA dehydrogenase [Xanthomonas campestris pv. raphani]MEA9768478.1 acyl-CoA dehydrogenase [Xanthomonas campestris pv. raphani]MEA9869629.1 acyl-CoA dehydrogenase [Xanthomonas campestris pv. raphani]
MNARISPMTLILSSPSPASAQSGLDLAAANTWLAMHPTLPLPGRGNTLARWRILANIAAADLCVAKLLEAHYDAHAICADLGSDLMQPGQCWAVWAAEPPGTDMHFTGNALHGTKAWCSGAAQVTHALVTAPHQGAPGLFAVALNQPGVRIDASAWQALGMRAIETANVTFSATPAQLVAADAGYLARPGFWHGGAGIAACWFGATTAVADVLRQSPRVRRDPHAAAHLGAIDAGLASTRALMRELAARIDAQPHLAHQREVMQLRSSVEAIARDTVDRVARALGPGPLCMQGVHAQRCADLLVFIRQHHAERDLQSLGERCHQEAAAWTL